MKKFYDKLLLALAVLALLGGVAFYLLKTDVAEAQGTSSVKPLADNPYQPVPISDPSAREAVWPEPGPQSSGPNWLYDVFTPPKIYLDAEGNFTAEPPKAVEPPEPFGIYLAEIERKPYRIQMQGFSGDRDKPEEAVLFFFDEERQLRFFIREGQSNEESEVEVLDFTIQREIDAEIGKAEVTVFATILDKRSGEEVQLNEDERLLEPEIFLVFRSEQDSTIEVKLTIEPENPVTAFETSLGEYVLEEINLEDRTVTVKKKATEETEARTRTLSPEIFKEPKAEEPKEESEEATVEEVDFDFEF